MKSKESLVFGILVGMVAGLCGLSSEIAHAQIGAPVAVERIEVPIGTVFIPPVGYDDNDNIQFVLDGFLPNGCYSTADQEYHADPTTKEIEVHLFAYHRTDAICANERNLPNSLQGLVPYDIEMSVGSLAAGNWRIFYPRPGMDRGIRPFEVDIARSTSVDDMPYAAINDVSIPDVVLGGHPMTAIISGSLMTSCSFLQPTYSVKLVQDVFIVLQAAGFSPNVMCTQDIVPFSRTIALGTVRGEGRYLIHVRSMNGRSVNRVFSIIVPDPT